MKIHEKYIKRCIQLAQNGLGNTYPNPLVGSVLVINNKVIGEGWHKRAGEPHAEVNAINSVKDKSLLSRATIYVSLEPCSHYGKTPPCSDLIIASGIKKVVIGCVDPYSEVSGKGITKLLNAGCEVIVGVLEKECQELNKRFFTFHLNKRPYIILKWAQTMDGFIAPIPESRNVTLRKPVWITHKYSKQLVHKWRSEEQGIMVGTITAIADNPKLNTRFWKGENPVRIVMDQHGKIPQNSALFDGETKTILLTNQSDKQNFLSDLHNFHIEKIDFSSNLIKQICTVLYKHGLQSVIIEGGATTLQTFLDANLWDEARVFTGNSNFKEGIPAPILNQNFIEEHSISGDSLKIYRND